MQLAETLGITIDKVRPHIPDTDSIGFTQMTGGSRTTYATGLAAYEAARAVQRELIKRAAVFLEIPEDDLEYVDGAVRSRSLPDKRMTFDELAARANREGEAVVGTGTVNPRGAGPGFAIHIVDIEIDTQTGKADVIRYTGVQDAGTAIYPPYVEGQMQGGMAQGVGWALNEEYVFDPNGRMLNSSYLDYRMPTALDLPNLETVIVEVPNPLHPYGVRGVGETGIVPPLAAVANAAYDALKVRFPELPISPRRILEKTILNGNGSAAH
jgi:CO/xanthine dehydrogenase Mo-binding subunit